MTHTHEKKMATPKKAAHFLLILLLTISCSHAATDNSRVNAAAAIFDAQCIRISSNFTELDQRATEAHYEVVIDRKIPMPNGQIIRQKNWLIHVPFQMGASTMLTSNDVTNGSLHVFGCGVYVPDLDGAAMESGLSALPRLGIPTKHTKGDGGATVTWWSARVGEQTPSKDSEVMLSSNMPGMPGVGVNLIFKTRLEPTH